MRIQKTLSNSRYILDPGDYYVSDKPVIISTLLGSCVAACLYDSKANVMAMNHFLLSNQRYKREGSIINTEAGRYGVHAMELIINGMLKIGADRKNIKAKAFGGGNVLPQSFKRENHFNIGDLNIRFIREYLENERIPLISSDLGGNCGRVIYFYGSDYSVYVRKIISNSKFDIGAREAGYLDTTIKNQTSSTTEVELWKQ